MLIVFRIGGLTIFGPVFGSPVVPVRLKVLLSLVLGIGIYPIASVTYLAPVGGAAGLELGLWVLGPLVAVELLIGLLIGFVASLPLIAAQTGGLLMGQQMGLGFARFYNPAIDDQADIVGQILFFMALCGFLVIGGHEAMVLAILRSFEYLPIGVFTVDHGVVDLILGLLLSTLDLALRVAAPLLAVISLQSIAMGYMAKTVPQLNILSLGFPIRILVGISIIMVGLAVLDEVLMDGVHDSIDRLFDWMRGVNGQ